MQELALFVAVVFLILTMRRLRALENERKKMWVLLDVVARGSCSPISQSLYAEIRNRKDFSEKDLFKVFREINRKHYEEQRVHINNAINRADDAKDFDSSEKLLKVREELDTMFTLVDCIDYSSPIEFCEQIMNSIAASAEKLNKILSDDQQST